MKQYTQIKAKDRNPLIKGWYHTDQGELYWFAQETVWSCTNDRISEEYPEFWYEAVLSTPLKQLSEITDEDAIEVRDKFYSHMNPALTLPQIRGEILFHSKKTNKGAFSNELIQHIQLKGYDISQSKQLSDEEIDRQIMLISDQQANKRRNWGKGQIVGMCPTSREDNRHLDGFEEGAKWARNLLSLSPQSDHINPIELLEWVKNNHKYCEPDGWKDENGLGETLTTSQLIQTFNNRTK